MKKATYIAIKTALTNFGYSDADILAEIDKEINRGEEKKAANAKAYEGVHDLIVGNLTNTPCTCAELYDAIKDQLPSGFERGKVQYALTHRGEDEIVKIEGSPNTYRRA